MTEIDQLQKEIEELNEQITECKTLVEKETNDLLEQGLIMNIDYLKNLRFQKWNRLNDLQDHQLAISTPGGFKAAVLKVLKNELNKSTELKTK